MKQEKIVFNQYILIKETFIVSNIVILKIERRDFQRKKASFAFLYGDLFKH